MLSSAEHETLNAHKYENIKKFSIFHDHIKPRTLFFLLINVKMLTIVGILTLMSKKLGARLQRPMIYFDVIDVTWLDFVIGM